MDDRLDEAKQAARQAALDYHEFPKPGKLEIRATKPLANGRDLARAYSPGVAEACLRGDAHSVSSRWARQQEGAARARAPRAGCFRAAHGVR